MDLFTNFFSQVILKTKSPAKQDDTVSFEAGLLAQYGVKEQNSTNMTETGTMSQVRKIIPFHLKMRFNCQSTNYVL